MLGVPEFPHVIASTVHQHVAGTGVSTQSSAGMATADYAETVAGRHVIIWPDDDPPHERTGKRAGPEAAIKAAARILDAGAISVRMVNPEAVAHLVPAGSKDKGADAADIRPEHLPELLEDAADAAVWGWARTDTAQENEFPWHQLATDVTHYTIAIEPSETEQMTHDFIVPNQIDAVVVSAWVSNYSQPKTTDGWYRRVPHIRQENSRHGRP